MELFIYSRKKCTSSAAQEGQRGIRTDGNGCILLSSALAQESGLREGSMAVLVGDEDGPKQWSLRIVDDEGGFSARLKKRKRYNSKGLLEEYYYGAVLNCSYPCHKILDNVGADKSATLMLATMPIEMEGLKLYKVSTSNPITRSDRKHVRKKDRTQTEI